MHHTPARASLKLIPAFVWVAIAVRVVWALLVGVDPVSDSLAYKTFATSIASGAGYAYPSGELTVYWPVGASAFYALVHYTLGHSSYPLLFVNIVIGTGIVYLSYLLSLRYFGEKVAVRAGWLVTLWPVLIQFTTVYSSELLFTLLLLATLQVWSFSFHRKVHKACLWGALLCAATYVRPTALPLFLLLPVLELWATRDLRQALTSGVVAALTAAARNQAHFGHPVLVSANFGCNLWMGNNPLSKGEYMPLPNIKFDNEVVRDQHFKQLAIDFIKEQPVEYIKLALRRFVLTYDRETIGVAWNQPALAKLAGEAALPYLKLVSTLYWWLVAALAVAGVGRALRVRAVKVFNPLLVVSACFFMVPILTVGQDRYHLPLDPLIAAFAAYAIHQLLQLVRKKSS
jgi:hypothetical protein